MFWLTLNCFNLESFSSFFQKLPIQFLGPHDSWTNLICYFIKYSKMINKHWGVNTFWRNWLADLSSSEM